MANINLTSTNETGFLENDFDQIKGVLQENSYNAYFMNEVLSFTAGEDLTDGDLCYLKSDGNMWKADASAESTSSGLLGIALENISANNSGTFLIKGRYTTTGLTTGDILYISETAGEWTNTAPTTSTSIVRIIVYALSSTILFFAPDGTYIENS